MERVNDPRDQSPGSVAVVELPTPKVQGHVAPNLKLEEGGSLNPRVLFVVNTDWFFLSHRRTIAQALSEAGYDVIVATPDTGRACEIRQIGFKHETLKMKRWGINPFAELMVILRLLKLYRKFRPSVVHHSTPKVIFAGSIAARLDRRVQAINLVSGFGSGMSSRSRLVRPLVNMAFKLALRCPRSIAVFQNPDDLEESVQKGFVRDESCTFLIRGSGVDIRKFRPEPEPMGIPVVLFASRMLIDKGVPEVIRAARSIKAKGYKARFVLVGEPDDGAERCVTTEELQELNDTGVIEWLGRRSDMPRLISQSAVVVLPTRYKEGLPKVLLEATASARPIVTTAVPGCREVVRDGVNGFLVPPGDQDAFEQAIMRLLDDPTLRASMGMAGRQIAENEFSDDMVVSRNLSMFRGLVVPGPERPWRPKVTLDAEDPNEHPIEATVGSHG